MNTQNRDGSFKLYVIYEKPKDHPNHFVVREWNLNPLQATPKYFIAETLEGARAKVPFGLTNLGRDSQDDPVIVETWI